MTIHESVGEGGVLELVMDNPKVNALPVADTLRIAEVLDGVRHRPEITVVILTATGRGFSAGVDIKEMQAMPGNEGILRVNQACFDAFRSVYECAVPVVCAVNDFCLGTGIGLDGGPLRAYLESDADIDEVLAENARAHRLGINGVPAYVIDGEMVISGAQDPAVIARVMDVARAGAA